LTLLEGVQLAHVLLDGGAVVLPGAEEALILRAVQSEPLFVGAVAVAGAVLIACMDGASFLARAMSPLDRRMRAIALTVAVTARVYPIPVCKDTPILNSDYINILDGFQ
jgi:hypothetical protein